MVLNRIGIRAFNRLPVTRFALSEAVKSFLKSEYSFALAANFQPRFDDQANIGSIHQPVAVLAGPNDEAFKTDALEAILRAQGRPWPVTLLPGISHIPLTPEARAVSAAVAAVEAVSKHGR